MKPQQAYPNRFVVPASSPPRNSVAVAAWQKHAGAHAKPWKALRRQQRQKLVTETSAEDADR
ncbi:hypothetical protein [Propionivibrio sp.]|uniref:hypothetical protein n=1 Tax=Propionivibrio sp. TaxID=2212460 RepID=UPI003BF227D1